MSCDCLIRHASSPIEYLNTDPETFNSPNVDIATTDTNILGKNTKGQQTRLTTRVELSN
jgi:hypothetical protein